MADSRPGKVFACKDPEDGIRTGAYDTIELGMSKLGLPAVKIGRPIGAALAQAVASGAVISIGERKDGLVGVLKR
eukprot:scaffold132657_cov18-Prasinocladus_malaysianus.AAC.1